MAAIAAKNYYEQSLLWGGLPRNEVLRAVSAVTDRHNRALENMFAKYTGNEMSKTIKDKYMTLDQLMIFSRYFQLCPGLLPRIEVLQLYQCSLTPKVTNDPDSGGSWKYSFKGNMAKQKGSFGGLSYEDFLLWLAATAGVVFSGTYTYPYYYVLSNFIAHLNRVVSSL